MRLLVCGGRDFDDRLFSFKALDAVHAKRPVTLVIHVGARGADALAGEWAKSRGIDVSVYRADWELYGKRAGHVRNQRMLDGGKPNGVVAFPGGRGTADMVKRSADAGIVAWLPSIKNIVTT